MDSPRDVAGRLDEAAANLSTAAATVAAVGPGERAFGVDGPGRLGELGRALHGQWLAATDARVREASGAASLLAETAGALRAAAGAYADVDDAARRRHPEEG